MVQFGTKAETLSRLEGKLQHAKVLAQVSFTVLEWIGENKEHIWSIVSKKFGRKPLAVRSSGQNEDTETQSNAGKFESVLNVCGRNEFMRAVEVVAASFGEYNDTDQILVQPMLEEVAASGVAFTVEPNTQGAYYVINYDDISGSTESITSGSTNGDHLFYCFKEYNYIKNLNMQKVCRCLKELETLFVQDNLDVEFAIDTAGELYVFQVRPLCVLHSAFSVEKAVQKKALESIYTKIKEQNKRKPFLYGKRTIYGVMPDWNPAEIIGIRPKPLALSLYKEIITDNIWAYQRDNYGYRNLRSFPLLIDFYGLPYIDVRVSFNSFIPVDLKKEVSDKLVSYYLDKLEKRPDLHDKIEFEIAYTCYTLDLPERISELREYGFTQEEVHEIIDALREMTKKIIDNEEGLWKKDYAKIEYLVERYEMVQNSDLDKISKIYWLLEDCKRYGTLPFAGLARAGFIAIQLLKSMVNKSIISEEEYQLFMGDLNTVSSIMKKDMLQLSKSSFLSKYGHLRPGTYDITSKRYDAAPDLYFDWETLECKESLNLNGKQAEFKLTLSQMNKLRLTLHEHGLPEDVLGIFHFIKTAIEGREFAKFVFTKSLSLALQLFEEMGEEMGIGVEELAYADVNVIKSLYASGVYPENTIIESIRLGKDKYRITKSLTLPPIICHEDETYAFFYPETEPNYITLKKVSGEVVLLSDKTNIDIRDKIVIIPSADPGYDWLFSHHIKGFITKYGGANSHMAIRANELQIPAAIGVGEKLFEYIKAVKAIELDSVGRRINILK